MHKLGYDEPKASPNSGSRVKTAPLICGCTITTRAELAHARVLSESFVRYHRDSAFSILVLDSDAPASSESAGREIIGIEDLRLDVELARRWAMLLDARELSAAVKPWLLTAMLRKHPDAVVVYLHFEGEVFAELNGIAQLAEENGLAIAQPTFTPTTEREENHASLAYSEPLVVVATPGAGQTLDQWREKIRAGVNGFATEKLLSPDVSAFYLPDHSYTVIDDPGINSGYWNLEHRKLIWTGAAYEIDGVPLRFFNFAGFDVDKPHLLTTHQNEYPRVLLSENPALAKLCDERGEKLAAAGYKIESQKRYGLRELSNQLVLDRHALSAYRTALAAFIRDDEMEPPSPFFWNPGGEDVFIEWLNTSVRKKPPAITRYMLAIHDGRPDLQAAFPDPLATHAIAFHDWFLTYGQKEEKADDRLFPDDAIAGPVDKRQPVVTVAGYFRAELGIGEAARLLVSALETSNTPCHLLSYGETISRQEHPFAGTGPPEVYSDINIICVNADRLPGFIADAGEQLGGGRYSIAVWFWEVQDFPPSQHVAFNYIDEVWVASDFVRETFWKVSPKRIFKFPLPVVKPAIDPSLSRRDLQLPDDFLFLFNFDFLSVFERKNPLAIIEAFKRAFTPGEGASLVIKTINGDQRIPNLEKLKLAAAKHPDIIVQDGYLSAAHKNTMTALCDCYVSLHRSEGFGLTMAEAMALGKPVIATGYSGNLEFMRENNSYLCSYRLVEIGPDAQPYPANSFWAEPDIDDAATFMRKVFTDREEANARGARAAEEIERLRSPEAAGREITARLETIRRKRTSSRLTSEIDIFEDRLDAAGRAQRSLLNVLAKEGSQVADAKALKGMIHECEEQLSHYENALDAVRKKSGVNEPKDSS
jgi:glycosyltransferase involved in cell wall biosynthesis